MTAPPAALAGGTPTVMKAHASGKNSTQVGHNTWLQYIGDSVSNECGMFVRQHVPVGTCGQQQACMYGTRHMSLTHTVTGTQHTHTSSCIRRCQPHITGTTALRRRALLLAACHQHGITRRRRST